MENRVFPITKLIIVTTEIILILRLVSKAFGLDSTQVLIQALYSISDVLINPFNFIKWELNLGNTLVEFQIFFALFVYGLLGFLILEILRVLFPTYKKFDKKIDEEYEND